MNVKIGIKIKELRKRDNITQELLAEVLGVTNQAISKWESESGYPDIECISSIADFFNVTIDYLFDHVPKVCLKILGFSSLKVVNGYLRDIAEPDYQVICVESGENIFDCVDGDCHADDRTGGHFAGYRRPDVVRCYGRFPVPNGRKCGQRIVSCISTHRV